jgi:hypothetical protein
MIMAGLRPTKLDDKEIIVSELFKAIFDNQRWLEQCRNEHSTFYGEVLGYIGGEPFLLRFVHGDNAIHVKCFAESTMTAMEEMRKRIRTALNATRVDFSYFGDRGLFRLWYEPQD